MLPTRGYWINFAVFFFILALFSLFSSGFISGVVALGFAVLAFYGGANAGLLETEFVRALIGERKVALPPLTSASATVFGFVFFAESIHLLFGNTGFFRLVFLFLSGFGAFLTYASVRIAITLYQQEQAAAQDGAPSATSANQQATDAINSATAASPASSDAAPPAPGA